MISQWLITQLVLTRPEALAIGYTICVGVLRTVKAGIAVTHNRCGHDRKRFSHVAQKFACLLWNTAERSALPSQSELTDLSLKIAVAIILQELHRADLW